MRRVLIFFSSFALVLVAGVALGAAGGDGPDVAGVATGELGAPRSRTVGSTAPLQAKETGLVSTTPTTGSQAGQRDQPATAVVKEGEVSSEERPKATVEEWSFSEEEPPVAKEAPPIAEKAPAEEEPEAPADTAPPGFGILHPVDGQVFETEKAVFEGEVEPGSRVFAGRFEAEVDGRGAWRIVLFLGRGENRATLRAVDAAGNESFDSVTVFFHPPAPAATHPREEAEEPAGEFSARQLYGSCGEDPPYDVFYGHGLPGDTITVVSEHGSAATTVGPHGEWEARVDFPTAPVGHGFPVKIRDGVGHVARFEFVRTGGDH